MRSELTKNNAAQIPGFQSLGDHHAKLEPAHVGNKHIRKSAALTALAANTTAKKNLLKHDKHG